jgi:hypothetical protein
MKGKMKINFHVWGNSWKSAMVDMQVVKLNFPFLRCFPPPPQPPHFTMEKEKKSVKGSHTDFDDVELTGGARGYEKKTTAIECQIRGLFIFVQYGCLLNIDKGFARKAHSVMY